MNALWQLPAQALAAEFAAGRASAIDIVEAHLARIDAVNPAVNAIVQRCDDDARAAARALDAKRAAGAPLGALAGVPFTVKQNIDVAGQPTTYGLAALANARAGRDSPVVARLRAADGILIGRTNLPDLGLRVHTDSGLNGLTKNPWNPARTVGGSSGGEAAALATGMSPLGLGNDLGGSLRNPATCCSIASIKPTFGLVPHANDIHALPETMVLQVLLVEGTMARRVGDVRAALAVLSGPDARDPWTQPVTLSASARPRRVALLAEPPGGDTDPRVAAVTCAAAAALAAAGVEVEEAVPPQWDAVIGCWHHLVVGGVSAARPMLTPILSAGAAQFIAHAATAAGPIPIEMMEAAWIGRRALAVAWAEFFQRFDAVLTPTWTQLPFIVGADIASPEGAAAALAGARPVLPANLLGLPSAAVPAGLVDGMPVGVLLTGPMWGDLVCLELAEHIERARLAPATPIDPRS